MLPKNGIFYGWWVVAASATIILLAGGTFFYGFGVLFNPILDEFGWSTLAAAAAFSLRSEVGAIAAPVAGILVDRIGPRKVLILGLMAVALGFFWLSRVHDLLTFYASFVLIALGNSAAGGQVGTVAVSWWFYRKRGRALSVMTLGPALSGITVPILAWLVINFGWRQALDVLGIAILGICLPLCFVIRGRPEQYGLLPDGDPPQSSIPSSEARVPLDQPSGSEEATPPIREPSISVKRALRTRRFWLLAGAVTLSNLGTTPAIVLLVPALTNVGFSTETAALAAAAIPLVSLPGRVGLGWWGDYVDRRLLMAGCYALQAMGMALLALISSELSLVAFVLVFSTGFGGPIPLRPALQAEHFGMESMGSIQGLLQFIATLGGFLGPIAVGQMVDVTGSYRLAFLLLGVCAGLAVPLMLAIPQAPAAYRLSPHHMEGLRHL